MLRSIQAIVFLPLIGFLIAGLFGTSIGAKASEYVTSGLMIIVAVLSWIVFFDVAIGETEMIKVTVMRWIQSGGFDVEWAFRVDTLTAVMFVVVNTVSMPRARLFDRLHASRSASAALLRLSVAVHLRHADADHV